MNKTKLVVAALGLAACSTTEYVYTPPSTPEGQACVAECKARETACRRDQDVRAERGRQRCEAEAQRRETECRIQAPIEYAACLKFAKNDQERAACVIEDCTQSSCETAPNYGLCDSDFRVCFQTCGGKVDLIER